MSFFFYYSSPDDIGTCWYILLSGSVFIKESMFLPRSRYVSYECTAFYILNVSHEMKRIFGIKRQCLIFNEAQKNKYKHPSPAFASCGSCFMPIARIESPSLWTVYNCSKCRADAVDLKNETTKNLTNGVKCWVSSCE